MGLLGRGREAARLVDELRELKSTTDEEDHALLVMKAQVLTECGALDEAATVIDEYHRARPNSEAAPAVTCLTAQVRLRRDDLAGVRESLGALGDIGDLSDQLAFATCSTWAGYEAMLGNFGEGREWADRSFEITKRVGSIALNLRAERNIGILQMLDGDLANSFSRLKRVWASYHELGATVGEVETAINLVHVAELLGFLSHGWQIGNSSLEVGQKRRSGARDSSRTWRRLRWNSETDRRAEDLASNVLNVGSDAPAFSRFVALTVLGELAAFRGQWETAERHFESCEKEV